VKAARRYPLVLFVAGICRDNEKRMMSDDGQQSSLDDIFKSASTANPFAVKSKVISGTNSSAQTARRQRRGLAGTWPTISDSQIAAPFWSAYVRSTSHSPVIYPSRRSTLSLPNVYPPNEGLQSG